MKTKILPTLRRLTLLAAAPILTAGGLTGCQSKLPPPPSPAYDLEDTSFSQQPGIGSNTNNEVKS
jgi:hypothetical protein